MQRSPRGSPSSALSCVYPPTSGLRPSMTSTLVSLSVPAVEELQKCATIVERRRVLRPICRVDLSVDAYCARPPMTVSSSGLSAASCCGSTSPPSFL
ncbi:hypothetical protein NDU88_007954 [Pleurodeles waltl]|uniref:Uncharacterized protein n=1 Tax=Pleurodeles waltl TaxID=8319 RepID=A0AAV7QQI3_PLEWA|nr:hypothetical protein NDU88_007954 [Pleurodeles waltl]